MSLLHPFNLQGKTALVTGCNKGIGFAMAEGLAEAGANIIGVSSGAQYTLTTYDPLDINVKNEQYDNKYIQTNADAIIDFSESNPFGTL